MGSFFKGCNCTRQGRCSHPYLIRYRDASGRQREEKGYGTQLDALDRLTKIYRQKQDTPQQALEKRELGKQRCGEYCSAWLPRQRHFAPGTIRTVNRLLDNHVLPSLESRRVNTFSPTWPTTSSRPWRSGARASSACTEAGADSPASDQVHHRKRDDYSVH
ncbi:hypothetical protein ACWCYZ_04190 [Streptomyces virginiae]